VQFPMLFWLSNISGWSLILLSGHINHFWEAVYQNRTVVLLACWWILGYPGDGRELLAIDIWVSKWEDVWEVIVTMIAWD
jgi:hypothetical protein